MWSPILLVGALSARIANFIRFALPGGQYLWKFIDLWSLFLVSALRLLAGKYRAKGLDSCRRPQQPLILYEFESCPYCRIVRETLCVLDIDYLCYPCPRETLKTHNFSMNSKYRPEVLKQGGACKFPFLIDPNTNRKMYESSDIVAYLWETYGKTAEPTWGYKLAMTPRMFKLSMIALVLRPCMDMGALRAPSHRANQPLELWGFECSPFVKRVRECLCKLELPYICHPMPTGSPSRKAFAEEYGAKFTYRSLRLKLGLCQIPFLKDPNTGVEMFESADIVRYLESRYQTAPVPNESWLDFGRNSKSQ